jgi:lysophospholipase L1-like esterase
MKIGWNFRLLLSAIASCALVSAAANPEAATHHKNLSKGGIVLMLGDSIFDLHEGDKRIEAVLGNLLALKMPHAHWMIYNEAHGGEYIGPKEGSPTGVWEPLFTTETTGVYFEIVKRHPWADVVFINFGANDSKVYPPSAFRERLEMVSRQLQQDYPGAVMIFSTTMYLDPKHSAPYHQDHPQVPGFVDGGSRNDYLKPYNREVREFTAAHGYGLADTYRHLESQTRKGNWDLRLRGDDGESAPRDDDKHVGDMGWFDNIHPNDRGTRMIADVFLKALLKWR